MTIHISWLPGHLEALMRGHMLSSGIRTEPLNSLPGQILPKSVFLIPLLPHDIIRFLQQCFPMNWHLLMTNGFVQVVLRPLEFICFRQITYKVKPLVFIYRLMRIQEKWTTWTLDSFSKDNGYNHFQRPMAIYENRTEYWVPVDLLRNKSKLFTRRVSFPPASPIQYSSTVLPFPGNSIDTEYVVSTNGSYKDTSRYALVLAVDPLPHWIIIPSGNFMQCPESDSIDNLSFSFFLYNRLTVCKNGNII